MKVYVDSEFVDVALCKINSEDIVSHDLRVAIIDGRRVHNRSDERVMVRIVLTENSVYVRNLQASTEIEFWLEPGITTAFSDGLLRVVCADWRLKRIVPKVGPSDQQDFDSHDFKDRI